MSAQRWTLPQSTRHGEANYFDFACLVEHPDGEYVLAADYERDVAAAREAGRHDALTETCRLVDAASEAKGWNAALDAIDRTTSQTLRHTTDRLRRLRATKPVDGASEPQTTSRFEHQHDCPFAHDCPADLHLGQHLYSYGCRCVCTCGGA